MLEVMLATVIFAIVLTALYTTFRIGLRAYEAGEKRLSLDQQARFVFGVISRDLRSVYYREETEYNFTLRRSLDSLEQMRITAEHEGYSLEDYLAEKRGEEELSEEDREKLNPYYSCIPLDVNFKGDDHEGKDTLSFAYYQNDDGEAYIQPWSLAQVKYCVKDDELIRSEDQVFAQPKDLNGEAIPTPEAPEEVIASGVQSFDLKYGFFSDGEWLEANDWNAKERKYRNPAEEIDPEDLDYQVKVLEQQRKPKDNLPAYVFVKLVLKEAKDQKTIKAFSTLVRLFAAQETFLPPEEEEEEE